MHRKTLNDYIFIIFSFQEPITTTRKSAWTRRCASLRQTRSPTQQISMDFNTNVMIRNDYSEINVACDRKSPHGAGSICGAGGSVTATSTLPRKSNWEVIEHYNVGSKGRGSVSSSLIAAGVTRYNLDGSIESANSGTPTAHRDQQHHMLGIHHIHNKYF